MEIKKQLAEIVMWEQVRQDCKYPKEDNNNGLIYGLYLIDDFDEDNWCGDIVDVEWFETDEERYGWYTENEKQQFYEYGYVKYPDKK